MFFFFKQKTAYEMRISDWSSDVCSSDLAYIICPQRLAVGDSVVAGERVDTKPGNAMLLGQMPVGTICHNVEMKPGKGGQIARSAGTYVQLVGRDRNLVIVRINSGDQRYLRADCMAKVGAVSDPDNQNQHITSEDCREGNVWLSLRNILC